MQETGSRAYKSLDFWRGFAAIWVVLFHSISSIQTDSGRPLPRNIFVDFCLWGDAGVVLFFVISGYCIAVAAANIIDRDQPVRRFITARVRRIFPPHWVVLLLFILMAGVAWFAQHRGIISDSNLAERFTLLTPWAIATNATLLQVPLKQDSINIVAWTLSYEIAFYAVMAVAIFTLRKRGWQQMVKVLHVLTVIAFSLVVLAPRWAIFPFDLWMSFGVGVLLFDLLCGQPWKERRTEERLFYTGVLIVIPLLVGWRLMSNGADKWAGQNLLVIVFAALLYFLHPVDKKIAQTKFLGILSFVGGFSYSLYLTHYLIVGILRQFARKLKVPIEYFVLEMFVDLAICVAFAYIFYLLVESRFITAKVKASTISTSPPLDPTTQVQTSPG